LKNEVRESNFQNAQDELAKVVGSLENIKKLYFKPMKLYPEINATDKAIGYLSKAIKRLTNRIEISQRLSE
jgi:peptidoglycan hydrolase CwlO-like protein